MPTFPAFLVFQKRLSLSVFNFQKMFNVCYTMGYDMDTLFNSKKSLLITDCDKSEYRSVVIIHCGVRH